MFEIADRLDAALRSGRPLAVATAVSISGSAPRTIGTSMAFDGEAVFGSIAGGCVEGAVVEVCERVLADGRSQTVEYGISDDTAFGVGLTCGGQLRIHVQLVTPDSVIARQLAVATRGGSAAIASVITGSGFERRVAAELDSRIALGSSGLGTVHCEGEDLEVFFEVSPRPARMIIFGAMEFSAALAAASTVLGYRVTVCDPRSLFTTAERFPGVEIVVEWPTAYLARTQVDERTVICVLSHDDRFDTELIADALALPVAYVGAMGSRRTSDRRFAELRAKGISKERLDRLHSPIGLSIGASTPEETAVSILAEVLACRAATAPRSLRSTAGSIHRDLAIREPEPREPALYEFEPREPDLFESEPREPEPREPEPNEPEPNEISLNELGLHERLGALPAR
ncbi:MAG: XdhC/CoxI family protein [Glaciihabitans sp.]|nr:XdhC/CoxI family protein [Glaciihabitans sp.]